MTAKEFESVKKDFDDAAAPVRLESGVRVGMNRTGHGGKHRP